MLKIHGWDLGPFDFKNKKKTLSKSFAKLFQASVALIGSQNRESIGNSLFIHCTLVKKQGTGLGGDISISKVVLAKNNE